MTFRDRWQSAVESLDNGRGKVAISCLLAVAVTMAAWVVTRALPALHTQAPASLFLMAVMLASLYGGFLPGLTAAAASWFLVDVLVSGQILNPLAMPVAGSSRAVLFVVVAVVVSALDAQRRKARNALRLREQHLRVIVENSTDVITIIRQDGTIAFESPALELVTGHKPENLIGRNVFDFVHPDDLTAARTAMARLLAQPGTASDPVEVRFVAADGSYRVLEAIGKNLVDQPGVNGILIHSRDIGVRKQLIREREARADSEAAKRRFQDLVQGLEMIVWEADPATGRMTFVSRRVQTVLGYSPESWTGGGDWMHHALEEDRPLILHAWDDAKRAGNSGCEYRGLTAEGRPVWMRMRVSATRDENGNVLQLRGLIADVTERRQAEATLRATERLAATGRLAASIAHEINNPMAAVTNLVYLIENCTAGNEQAGQFARLAQEELKRMAHITRQMLGFYRDSADPMRVDLYELLQGVLDLYDRRIKNSGIDIEVRRERAPEVLVFAGEIRQVISNLLINAIDAMPDGGRICVRVRTSRDWRHGGLAGARIVIADNGRGIPDTLKTRIFEPFFTTKGQKGTGLGLWVSEGIVQKHRGTLRVRSTQREGRSGTCFSIFLPAVDTRAASTAA